MKRTYKIIGFLNLFDITPDFVIPVFESNGNLYFQEGKNDKIEKYSSAKPSIAPRVIPLTPKDISDTYNNLFDVSSDPIYAFQTEKQVVYGTSPFMKKYFSKYFSEDKLLLAEISDFLQDIQKIKEEKPLYPHNLYHPKTLTYYGTGRRKTSVARVYLTQGTGKVIINNRNIDDYFGLQTLRYTACQPLNLTNNSQYFDVTCKVSGGGISGQAGAISLGMAKALLEYDIELKSILKKAKLLTRDARVKERKKYGLKAARRAPQFSKR